MKSVSLFEVKNGLSGYLRLAAGGEEIVITRHGKPAGVLIGFETEDDWFDYKLENDPRFLMRMERARASIRAGKGTRLEDIEKVLAASAKPAVSSSPAKPASSCARSVRRRPRTARKTR